MLPEICKIGPFTIYSYGLMLAIAFFLCSALLRIQAKLKGFNPDIIFNLIFFAFISGIFGARLFYVIENIKFYLEEPLEVIMLQRGGLSWFGGLLFGAAAGTLYLKKKKLPADKTLDLIAPYAALGQSIGRIGCFLNGCCYGKNMIPVQLYSSLLLLIMFCALRALQERKHKPGEVFFAYLFLYSVKRFFIEFLRADNEPVLFSLSLFQLISIGIFSFSLFKLISVRKSKE